MAQNQIDITVPEKLLPIFTATHRFITIHGGRGSAKSHTVARMLLVKGMQKKSRFLCCREIQKSISQSVHKLLSDIINDSPVLSKFYVITEKAIRGANGTEFIFQGLYQNEQSVKSTEGIDVAWVEEAQSISRKSLAVLIPTIRQIGSQIIFTLNPTNTDDPVYVDYVLADRPDNLRIECNYSDNPFFPDVLRADMEFDRAHDSDAYLHIWEGKPVRHSDAQVFKGKWVVDEFEAPEKTFFYFGCDWGFANDATTLVRCFIKDNRLYIDYDYYKVGLELPDIIPAFKSIPESVKYPIFADCARPDTISYVRNNGFPLIVGAEKGKGSIEDGIEHIKGYEKVVIHPRCTHTIDEFQLYSYKVDPRTDIISNDVEDKNNHCIDAIRYALSKLIKGRAGKASIHYDF